MHPVAYLTNKFFAVNFKYPFHFLFNVTMNMLTSLSAMELYCEAQLYRDIIECYLTLFRYIKY